MAKSESGNDDLICLRQSKWGRSRIFNGGCMRLAAILVLLSALTLSAAQDSQFIQLPSFAAAGFNPRTAEGTYDIVVQVDGVAVVFVMGSNL